ncbi:MAG: RNA 2',3'-cyclic phosphodiesterase [Bowdeniella nasicola]|nr:RNA 2',3'-cyclic phosphodiesterase [Bowdeniella nasicola]
MGQRMFIALYPPAAVVEEMEAFFAARPQLPWIDSAQWHITLAFLSSVPAAREDELIERLRAGFARKTAPHLQLVGGGAFPSLERAKLLWLRPVALSAELGALAVTARSVANACGATPDGRAFHPHLTVARLRRPIHAMRWMRIFDAFTSQSWLADEARLIASYLGEGPAGRPRHEIRARFRLHQDD